MAYSFDLVVDGLYTFVPKDWLDMVHVAVDKKISKRAHYSYAGGYLCDQKKVKRRHDYLLA